MKKLFSVVAMLAIVAAIAVGCKKEEPIVPAPADAAAAVTNAPAAP
jgi:predicted small lipoprotein YifL